MKTEILHELPFDVGHLAFPDKTYNIFTVPARQDKVLRHHVLHAGLASTDYLVERALEDISVRKRHLGFLATQGIRTPEFTTFIGPPIGPKDYISGIAIYDLVEVVDLDKRQDISSVASDILVGLGKYAQWLASSQEQRYMGDIFRLHEQYAIDSVGNPTLLDIEPLVDGYTERSVHARLSDLRYNTILSTA